MANVPDYVTYLLNHERQWGAILGVDIMGTGRELYDVNLINAALFGWLIKTLVDNGVLTEAQLDATMQIVLNGTWPAWVTNPADNPPPP
jgi:hypothetical protein